MERNNNDYDEGRKQLGKRYNSGYDKDTDGFQTNNNYKQGNRGGSGYQGGNQNYQKPYSQNQKYRDNNNGGYNNRNPDRNNDRNDGASGGFYKGGNGGGQNQYQADRDSGFSKGGGYYKGGYNNQREGGYQGQKQGGYQGHGGYQQKDSFYQKGNQGGGYQKNYDNGGGYKQNNGGYRQNQPQNRGNYHDREDRDNYSKNKRFDNEQGKFQQQNQNYKKGPYQREQMFGEENENDKFQKQPYPQRHEQQQKPQTAESKPAPLSIKPPGFDKPLPKAKPTESEKIQAPTTPREQDSLGESLSQEDLQTSRTTAEQTQSSSMSPKTEASTASSSALQFAKRPQVAKSNEKLYPPARQCNVVSNQYRLKLSSQLQVFQYTIDVQPMELWDPNLVQQILKSKRREMETVLGNYVCSGKIVYTITEIDQSLRFKTIFKGQTYFIVIDKSSMVRVNMAESSTVPESQSVMGQLLNIIIKSAFRETNLKQIGKAPRFFDVSNPILMQQAGLQIWSGFKAAAVQSKLGTMLCMDSIFKFMSTKSCLEQINEMQRGAKNQHHWEQMVKLEFASQSIIANWGNKRTYIVTDIDFGTDPHKQKFDYRGVDTSVADYFKTNYGMVVTDHKQPLFLIRNQDRDFYLPPEFCLLDGVSDEVRKGRGMRDALMQTRITPQTKIKKIQDMCRELFSKKSIKQWGLELEPQPQRMSTTILAQPRILKQNQVINCDESVLRRLPIQKPVALEHEKWIFVYENRNEHAANQVFNTMQMASKQLGIRVEEPYWIYTDQERNTAQLDDWLLEYMVGEDAGGKKFRCPTIVVVLLSQERNYAEHKLIFDKYQMPSQCITMRNAKSFNASKASNILRQMNSKVRGDLFNMKFPEVIDKSRTMLIGIDVCHSGRQSVVGFAASTNKELSQYYSDYLLVPKGQEIVKDRMKDLIKAAIASFSNSNKGNKPTNFIIYRDGVGDSMRQQVLDREIPQFREAINDLYNKLSPPELTVVIVNKRITQRFFVEDANGRLVNPPSGCIIDQKLVEQEGSQNENGLFDFYLTPANTTQGCVLPTHFFCAMNESKFSKLDIEHLTFALCHFYFNWAGPIKVPAPCQYGHKIAEFYTNVGLAKHDKQRKNRATGNDARMPQVVEHVRKIQPLAEKLHFL